MKKTSNETFATPDEEIAVTAYYLWEGRGRLDDGMAEADWETAKRHLTGFDSDLYLDGKANPNYGKASWTDEHRE